MSLCPGGILGITIPPHVAGQVREGAGGGGGCGNGEGSGHLGVTSVSPRSPAATLELWGTEADTPRATGMAAATPGPPFQSRGGPQNSTGAGTGETATAVPPLCHPGDVTEPETGDTAGVAKCPQS